MGLRNLRSWYPTPPIPNPSQTPQMSTILLLLLVAATMLLDLDLEVLLALRPVVLRPVALLPVALLPVGNGRNRQRAQHVSRQTQVVWQGFNRAQLCKY